MKFSKNSLIAAIAKNVHERGADDSAVFSASSEVLSAFRREQGAALALLLYKSSRCKRKQSRMKALAKGFEVLAKRRDAVLEAINTCRAIYGFGRYTLPELGVYSLPMATGIEGSEVWQAINSCTELMEALRHDQKQFERLLAWGRTIYHADEAAAAASAICPLLHKVWVKSILAIGNAVHKKGGETVPFQDGHGVQWAVDAYEAAMHGGKPGAVLRGVSDAIKAGINAAYFANRNAKAREQGYELAGVVAGHKSAFYILNPREQRGRYHEGRDAKDHEGVYAGGEDIIVEIGERTVNLGYAPDKDELDEALASYAEWQEGYAGVLLGDAAQVMGELTCPVRHRDGEYQNFEALKQAIWIELEERSVQRKEAAAANKALERAMLVVQVAAKMDAVSRRTFLSTQQHLPLAEATRLLAAESRGQAEVMEDSAKEAAYAEATAIAMTLTEGACS